MNTYYDKGLSNLSYTSKDFHTIYPELLELAKKLSYKWDPTTSMESDPGVVLIKLAALMADKQNYNIDKNTLELIPKSVTQLGNARQVFDQVGYRMKYFRSAVGDARIFLSNLTAEQRSDIGDKDAYVTFPPFVTIADMDSTLLYTTTKQVEFRTLAGYADVEVIQGSINDYSINGEKKITAANLDYLNRLYFQETDIAENGIFISTLNDLASDQSDYDEWKLVDNLAIQPLQTKCYKFGISQTNDKCYIEFPSDIATLIPDGIHLKYIRSDGINGNVGARFLTQFYDDLSLPVAYWEADTGLSQPVASSQEAGKALQLTTAENFRVNNLMQINNGLDPETIDEAYQNYEKIKNTFDTLLSTVDYSNYLVSGKYASNGFVCDRTDDPHASAKITHRRANAYATSSVTGKFNDKPLLEAFDLTVYAFKYADKFDTEAAYDLSYNLQLPAQINSVIEEKIDVKAICHNFRDLTTGQICLIKNKYPIHSRIIPTYKLTDFERDSVIEAVHRALYSALNSSRTKFGAEIDYDLVYDTIMSADTRIKAITLNDIEYTTYAVIKTDDGFDERELTEDEKALIYAKAILCDATPYYLDDPNNFKYDCNQKITARYEGINSITTSTSITLVPEVDKSGSDPVRHTCEPVRVNEAIYLTAPNIVQKEGGYQNCRIRTNLNIPANSEYLLQTGDWIEFYLVAGEEGAQTVDIYHHRGIVNDPDPIVICTPIALAPTQDIPSSLIPPDVLGQQSGNTIKYQLTNDQYTSIYLPANPTSTMISMQGLNEILIKRKNKITIYSDNLQSNLFWLTKRENNMLFDTDETEYTLEVGEEVIYTNASGTKVTILGEGTSIIRTGSTELWAIDDTIFDYEEFFQQGIDYLNYGNNGAAFWFKPDRINTGVSVEAQENVFHTLHAGAILDFSDTRGLDSPIVAFSNKYTSLASGEYPCKLTYITADNSRVELPYRAGELAWKVKSRFYLNASATAPQQLLENQSITFEASTAEDPVTLTNMWVKPNIEIPYLYGNQSATSTSCMIETFEQLDNSLNVTSGTAIILNDTTPLISLPYALSTAQDKEPFVLPVEVVARTGSAELNWSVAMSNLDDTSTPTVEPDSSASSAEPTAQAEDESYDLFYPDSEPTALADGGSDPELQTSGSVTSIGTFAIPFEQGINQQAIITLSLSTTNGSTITVKPLRPIRKILSPYMNQNEAKVREKMDSWLAAGQLSHDDFRLLDPADTIEDPLASTAFLHPAHPYNQYTICQWDSKSNANSILVSNKVR